MITNLLMPEARVIQRLFGEHGWRWIAERIGALALSGDYHGAERFRQIASCYRQLPAPTQR